MTMESLNSLSSSASAILVVVCALAALMCCRSKKRISRRAYEFQKLQQSNEDYYEDDYLDSYATKNSNLKKEYHDDPMHAEIIKSKDESRQKLLEDYKDSSSDEEEYSRPLKM